MLSNEDLWELLQASPISTQKILKFKHNDLYNILNTFSGNTISEKYTNI